MKNASLSKDNDSCRRFEESLREIFSRVPFLQVASIKEELPISSNSPWRADFVAHLKADSREWVVIIEAKRLGQPREIRTAVLQLDRYLKELPEDVPSYGLVVAPFISEESAAICTGAGYGYADLAGNARLSFDQIFIETHGAGNPFREKRETRSIFAPRATRILRFLLQGPLRPWKVTELAESAQVSLGYVSLVRQQLLAHEWAAETERGLQITKPGAVLDAWARSDDWKKRTQTREYSLLLTDPAEIASRVHRILGTKSHAFTQWFAAMLRHPHTSAPIVTLYVEEFPDEKQLEDELLGRRVESGGRLRLIKPKDEGVLNPIQIADGLPLVSDAQLYLDLIHAGLRGDDAAAELRKWPDFAGGWA